MLPASRDPASLSSPPRHHVGAGADAGCVDADAADVDETEHPTGRQWMCWWPDLFGGDDDDRRPAESDTAAQQTAQHTYIHVKVGRLITTSCCSMPRLRACVRILFLTARMLRMTQGQGINCIVC